MRIRWARLPSFVNCSLLCSGDCNRRRLEKSGWNVRERLVDNPGQARVPYILFRKERSGAVQNKKTSRRAVEALRVLRHQS